MRRGHTTSGSRCLTGGFSAFSGHGDVDVACCSRTFPLYEEISATRLSALSTGVDAGRSAWETVDTSFHPGATIQRAHLQLAGFQSDQTRCGVRRDCSWFAKGIVRPVHRSNQREDGQSGTRHLNVGLGFSLISAQFPPHSLRQNCTNCFAKWTTKWTYRQDGNCFVLSFRLIHGLRGGRENCGLFVAGMGRRLVGAVIV